MYMTEQERSIPPILTPYTQATSAGFTYLGVKITPDIKNIVSVNYDHLTESTTRLINKWTNLPISMIGRINILKMTILPRYLYLFQSIPLSPPMSLFLLGNSSGILYGITKNPESDYHCCTCPMTEAV